MRGAVNKTTTLSSNACSNVKKFMPSSFIGGAGNSCLLAWKTISDLSGLSSAKHPDFFINEKIEKLGAYNQNYQEKSIELAYLCACYYKHHAKDLESSAEKKLSSSGFGLIKWLFCLSDENIKNMIVANVLNLCLNLVNVEEKKNACDPFGQLAMLLVEWAEKNRDSEDLQKVTDDFLKIFFPKGKDDLIFFQDPKNFVPFRPLAEGAWNYILPEFSEPIKKLKLFLTPLLEKAAMREALVVEVRAKAGHDVASLLSVIAQEGIDRAHIAGNSIEEIIEEMGDSTQQLFFGGELSEEAAARLALEVEELRIAKTMNVDSLLSLFQLYRSERYSEEEKINVLILLKDFNKQIDSLSFTAELLKKKFTEMKGDSGSPLFDESTAEGLSLIAIQPFNDKGYRKFGAAWHFLRNYAESLLLEAGLKVSAIDHEKIMHFLAQLSLSEAKINTLIKATEKKPDSIVDNESKLLLDESLKEEMIDCLIGELFKVFSFDPSIDKFGLPDFLHETCVTKVKEKLKEALITGLTLFDHVKNATNSFESPDTVFKTKGVAEASLNLTNFAFDAASHYLIKPAGADNQLVALLKEQLANFSKEYPKLVPAVENVLDAKRAKIDAALNYLDSEDFKVYKEEGSAFLQPLFVPLADQFLQSLFAKEKADEAFDQKMVMEMLSLLQRQFNFLNASYKGRELFDLETFQNKAGDQLHPALPKIGLSKEKQEKQRVDYFYNRQTSLIFNLIFPKGKESLKEILPPFYEETTINKIWNEGQKFVASQLPVIMEVIFEKEMMVNLLHAILKCLKETLQEKVTFQPSAKRLLPPLTAEEEANNEAMNQAIGGLFIEMARFYNVPIDFLFSLPFAERGANRLFGMIGDQIRESIKKGDLVEKCVEIGLEVAKEQKFVKENLEENELFILEREIAASSVTYPLRVFGAWLDYLSRLLEGSNGISLLVKCLLSLNGYLFEVIIPKVTTLLGLDRLLGIPMKRVLRSFDDKTIKLLSNPAAIENLVFEMIDEVENHFMSVGVQAPEVKDEDKEEDELLGVL